MGVWYIRIVCRLAVPACGRVGLWPCLFVAVSVCGLSVCGCSGLWPFRFVAVSVCGLFGLWPFRLWPFQFVAVMTCYRVLCCIFFVVRYPPVIIYTLPGYFTGTGQEYIFKVHISTPEKLCDGITKHIRIQCTDYYLHPHQTASHNYSPMS